MVLPLPHHVIPASPATKAEEQTRSTFELLRSIFAQETDLPIHSIREDWDWRFINPEHINMDAIRSIIQDDLKIALTMKEIYREPNLGALAIYIDTLSPHPAPVLRTSPQEKRR